ncbi:tyrosine-type recombinase/integrase [Paucibacter soli]|uniref:tyrosine-type recombinase/integrase n=1 Tax=Paucibacter soli TaxID=3133433 RepID=UPI00309FB29A
MHIRQLGLHHFAYLRAIGEGLDMQEAAKRYLGLEHGHSTRTVHRQVVDKLRALARRRGDKHWRLIGLAIRSGASAQQRPDLYDWAAEQGLDGWRHEELMEMYQEAFPPDRKETRNVRLRERQMELLKSLQDVAAQPPKPTDLIEGWFDDATSQRLKQSGLLMIGELRKVIARGGRWWSGIPAIGQGKAERIEKYLVAMCGEPVRSMDQMRIAEATKQLTTLPRAPETVPMEILPSPPSPLPARHQPAPLDGSSGPNRALATASGSTARNDKEAIEAWIAARVGSEETAKSYRRETERLLLWCISERKKALSSMNLDDCLAYMAFLERIPPAWISRRGVDRFEEGWAPFSRQLSFDSRRQAIVVISAFFAWAVKASYLVANPWVLVNRKTGDDATKSILASRAFTEDAWTAVRSFLDQAEPSPARSRTIFIMDFGEATGLRASELVGTKLDSFKPFKARWALQVHGKGSKNRVIAVPKQAQAALERYLDARGLPQLGECPEGTPLVSSVLDPMEPVTYRPLYESTKAWFRKAIMASGLSAMERATAYKASLHWLRHTCGTRALERGASLAMVQEQLGHADPRMTMQYSKTQLEKLMDGMDAVFDE